MDNHLVTRISQRRWLWCETDIIDEIVKLAAPEAIEKWKKTDPLCSQYAWYNILLNFAGSRAERLGLTKSIRGPQKKICPLCFNDFIEDSLPMSLITRLGGFDRLNFCTPCLEDKVFPGSGNASVSKKDIIKYIQDVALLTGGLPSQYFGEGVTDLQDMSDDERLAFLQLLKHKPTIERVNSVFGSWLNALIQAGILEDGTTIKTSRGIKSVAKDGHLCLSLGEKMIDDYLFIHGIHHEKEPRYPEGKYRGDFKVGTTFIEYFGLTGNPEYDTKTKEKIRLCKEHNITLLAIYPKDLINQQTLENILSVFITKEYGK